MLTYYYAPPFFMPFYFTRHAAMPPLLCRHCYFAYYADFTPLFRRRHLPPFSPPLYAAFIIYYAFAAIAAGAYCAILRHFAAADDVAAAMLRRH